MWTERRQDIALAVGLAAVLATLYADRWLALTAAIVGSLALIWRRRFPLALFLVMMPAFLASLLWHLDSGAPLLFVTWFVIYGLAAYSTRIQPTRTIIALGAGTVVVLLLFVYFVQPKTSGGGPISALLAFGYVGTAWFLGRYHRTKRAYLAQLEERTAQLEREQVAIAAKAAAEERARLARELHDMLAHTMSGMVVLAGAARKIAETKPDAAGRALAKIEDVGRKGMAETRMLLDALHNGAAPTLDHLSTLVTEFTETGMEIDVRTEGTPRTVPLTVGVTAYRIVQESLTNVRRHSGTTKAQVIVRYWDDAIDIEITDDGHGGKVEPGHGITGMRERAELAGGELRAAPRPGGGWSVRAIFPVVP